MISDQSTELCGVEVEHRLWSSATEAALLSECDIGISWLPDDVWSRGKCGLKVLQYMAAGLPVVANPVGMNAKMVLHGQTGLLAATPGQWAAAVQQLAADPQLRRRMGAAGRRLVEERFSVARWGPELAAIVARTARRALPDSLREAVARETGPRAVACPDQPRPADVLPFARRRSWNVLLGK